MADNIKIVGEIINTEQVSRYDEADISLLNPQTVKEDFGFPNDYIEYYVYDIGNNILNYNLNPYLNGININNFKIMVIWIFAPSNCS